MEHKSWCASLETTRLTKQPYPCNCYPATPTPASTAEVVDHEAATEYAQWAVDHSSIFNDSMVRVARAYLAAVAQIADMQATIDELRRSDGRQIARATASEAVAFQAQEMAKEISAQLTASDARLTAMREALSECLPFIEATGSAEFIKRMQAVLSAGAQPGEGNNG